MEWIVYTLCHFFPISTGCNPSIPNLQGMHRLEKYLNLEDFLANLMLLYKVTDMKFCGITVMLRQV